MADLNAIKLININRIDKNGVEIEFKVPAGLKRFFNGSRFFVEYSEGIDGVPDSILNIPFISNIYPIALACKTDICVGEIDATFYQSLLNLKESYNRMYPGLHIECNVHYKSIVKNNFKKISRRTSQLFSGGVDSLATFVRKINEKPYLVTVWGADIKLKDETAWEKVKKYNFNLAKDLDTDIFFIKSNLKEFINDRELKYEYGQIVKEWWPDIQHGLGLAGLSAPLTYKKGIATFYIASSHTVEYKLPYGSHPTIDNQIRWADTKVVHEAYDLSRQQKIGVISNYIKTFKNDLLIRVCWKSGTEGGIVISVKNAHVQ